MIKRFSEKQLSLSFLIFFRAFRPKHLIVKYVPTELLRIIAKNELGFKIYFVVKSDIEVHFLYRL